MELPLALIRFDGRAVGGLGVAMYKATQNAKRGHFSLFCGGGWRGLG